MSDLAMPGRRYDLDWIRVIAFGLLIYFHAAIAYVPNPIPMIENREHSTFMLGAVTFFHQFRLSLLFLISGVGVAFNLRHRGPRAFFAERRRRLLRPLGFGVLVVVPPMVYYEKLFVGDFHGSFLAFYPRFFTEGIYPKGNLSWHHYWFIAYLFIFCLLGFPLFRYFESTAGKTQLARWCQYCTTGARLFAFILPLSIAEIALRNAFPNDRPDLIHDLARFTHWFLIFVAGYVFASNQILLDQTQRIRHYTLAVAVAATILLFVRYFPQGSNGWQLSRGLAEIANYAFFCAVRMTMVWSWLLAILGYAGVYLNRSSALLTYLNNAVYPLFCLHLTLIVILGYYIVPTELNLWVKYLLVTTCTLAIAFATYHWVIAPSRWLRPCFGLVSLPKSIQVNSAPIRMSSSPTRAE